jgi:hypothetical protein
MLFAVLVLSAIIIGAIALQMFTVRIPSDFNVTSVGLEVYWDVDRIDYVTVIYWGALSPDDTVTVNVWLYNNGTLPITVTFQQDNWSSELASQYLVIGWDYDGIPIVSDEIIPVTLSLHVDPLIHDVGFGSVDLVFVATETSIV